MNRFAPLALSAILPLLLFSWFVPAVGVQLDLLILWLVAMVLVGLPMVFLELVLAKRSQKSVWQGMQTLTREADAKVHWRIFSGLSVLTSFLVAGGIISASGESLGHSQALADISPLAVSFGLMVASLILSLLKGRLLLVGAVVLIVNAVLSLAMGEGGVVAVTAFGLTEWAMAVAMALVSTGLGTGLYWFFGQGQSSLGKSAMTIWSGQLIFGALALTVFAFGLSQVGQFGLALGAVLVAGFFVYYGASQLIARFGLLAGSAITVVVCLALSAVPSAVFGWGLIGVALLSALVLSLFAGFAMKISHLRKSFGFQSELIYNLWRVAVRLVVPIAIILAWIGWILVGLGK